MIVTIAQATSSQLLRVAIWIVAAALIAVIAWFLFKIALYAFGEEGTWPVSPASSDHPIANTFGELVSFRYRDDNGNLHPLYRKLHEGIDILAIPHGDPYASRVIVTAAGTVSKLDVAPDDNYNEVIIRATDGTHTYTYIHLEHPPPAALVVAYNNNNNVTVYPGEDVGTVRNAFPCEYDHLHYGVSEIAGGIEKAINPLEKIEPKPDPLRPFIFDVFLARHGPPRWSTFDPVDNRTVVSGEVDIVAKVTDRDDAGSTAPAVRNVGLYDVKWRACPSANPNCGWNETHRYDEMFSSPLSRPWEELFSFKFPGETVTEEWTDLKAWTWPEGYCPADGSTYMVLRKVSGAPSWNTRDLVNGSPKYPDGEYVLSVKALDYAKQEDIYRMNVCVENSAPASCQ